MSDISCTVVGVGKYEPEHNAVPVVERPHKKESGKTNDETMSQA